MLARRAGTGNRATAVDRGSSAPRTWRESQRPAVVPTRWLAETAQHGERTGCRQELQSRYLYWQVGISACTGNKIAVCLAPIYKEWWSPVEFAIAQWFTLIEPRGGF